MTTKRSRRRPSSRLGRVATIVSIVAMVAMVGATTGGCFALIDDDFSGGVPPNTTNVDGGDGAEVADGSSPNDDHITATDDDALAPLNDGAPIFPPLDGSSPCKTPHTFCDDFEHAAPADRFGQMELNGGSLAIDTAAAKSPARSLVASSTQSASEPAGPRLLTKLVQPAKKISTSFWFQRNEYGPEASATILFLVAVYADGRFFRIEIPITPTTASVEYTVKNPDAGTDDFRSIAANQLATPLGTWVHCHIDADIALTSSPSVSLYINGVLIKKGALVFDPPAVPTQIVVNFGMAFYHWNTGTTSWTGHFDDFVLDVEQ